MQQQCVSAVHIKNYENGLIFRCTNWGEFNRTGMMALHKGDVAWIRVTRGDGQKPAHAILSDNVHMRDVRAR